MDPMDEIVDDFACAAVVVLEVIDRPEMVLFVSLFVVDSSSSSFLMLLMMECWWIVLVVRRTSLGL
jgi:hypothetical protein